MHFFETNSDRNFLLLLEYSPVISWRGGGGGRRGVVRGERGSGWGIHVYLWQIHVDVEQNQYKVVK